MGLFTKTKKKKATSDFDKLLNEQLDILEESPLEPILWNEESKVYCQSILLNGYRSLSMIITGYLKINTIEGCTISLIGEKENLTLKSDSDIVKGDYSEALNIGVTNFDVDLDDDLIEFIGKEKIVSAKLETRNGQLIKSKLEFNYWEVDQELFDRILNMTDEEE